jgi:hypothetical protein
MTILFYIYIKNLTYPYTNSACTPTLICNNMPTHTKNYSFKALMLFAYKCRNFSNPIGFHSNSCGVSVIAAELKRDAFENANAKTTVRQIALYSSSVS